MTGHIRRRGQESWELKFDIGIDPANGKRKTRFVTFRGTKREAEHELARLITSAINGKHVDPLKLSVDAFLDRWETDWACSNLSPKTFERYDELLRAHVRPRLGSTRLQKVRPADLAALYAELLRSGRKVRPGQATMGLSPQTVGYIHRVLHRAFGHAVIWGLIMSNPTILVEPPRAQRTEVIVMSVADIKHVLTKLRGRPMYMFAALGLATGLRRGEMLALRWRDIDLDAKILRVERSLEQTKASLRFKSPKTRHGRRSVSLPLSIVSELKTHRRSQLQQRLALGLGREPEDALVFRQTDGQPLKPNSVSTEWRRLVKSLALPAVTLHSWRHTHASQLIAAGMDILRISRRLGHGSPSITLDVYGHLFDTNDEGAAAVFDSAFAGTITE